MGRFYADYRPERITEAEQLAQYALNWAKDDFQKALALHTLGRIFLVQDRKEEAKRVFSDAASIMASEGQIGFVELTQDMEKALMP